MGRHTSSVTVAGFLCPAINGIRSGEQTSAIPLVLLFHDLEVVHGRSDVQILQHSILPAVSRQPRNATLRVVQIAEDDCARGTGLLARGANVAILESRTRVL